ncbi:MAG: septum formation initiator family protein [Candidatus Paceibacterota bacterium]
MPRKKPKKYQRVVFSLPFLILATGLVILVSISAFKMYQTSRDTQETVDQLKEERDEMSIRQKQLLNTTANLSTQRGIEEEIREKFSVVKEGERVIVLVDDPDSNATSTAVDESWWRSLLDSLWPF